MHSVEAISNYFIDRLVLNPMKLQKLLYFANVASLLKYDEPLFNDPIMAVSYGPQIESVYEKTKHYGNSPIINFLCTVHWRDCTNETSTLNLYDNIIHEKNKYTDLLDKVIELLGNLSPTVLANVACKKGSAWEILVRDKNKDEVYEKIPNELMKKSFIDLYDVNDF